MWTGSQFTDKPFGKEVALINKRFHEVKADYVTIARNIGEYGSTFAAASFYNRRTNSEFKEEQLFALDFDSGTAFEEIKSRLEDYHLSMLFAYKTFSWKAEHEKFRAVILMLIQYGQKHYTEHIILFPYFYYTIFHFIIQELIGISIKKPFLILCLIVFWITKLF